MRQFLDISALELIFNPKSLKALNFCCLTNHQKLWYNYALCDWVCTAVMSNDVMKDLRG